MSRSSFNLQSSILNSKIPKHIAVVMDGNGRWAEQRNLPRIAGHRAGAEAVKTIIEACANEKVEVLTLFAFSSENWGRPTSEVDFLMELFLKTLKQQTKTLHKNNVQLRIIGDYSRFNEKLQKSILQSQQLTAANTGLKLVIAANYSGRWDIVEAARRLGRQIEMGKLRADDITTEDFRKVLCLADLPEPDLLIRTSGEQRISNFMLWQFAYTEFYFTNVLWPDFDEIEFKKALTSYVNRQRRFGLVGEQLEYQQSTQV